MDYATVGRSFEEDCGGSPREGVFGVAEYYGKGRNRYGQSSLLVAILNWRGGLVATCCRRQSGSWGWSFLLMGRIKEVQNPANYPVTSRNPEHEGHHDGGQQQE